MVRDTCTHHDGETCNSRMTALQPAASSSHHLLRARMRRLVMSTNLKPIIANAHAAITNEQRSPI
jgi:hypothetical protein